MGKETQDPSLFVRCLHVIHSAPEFLSPWNYIKYLWIFILDYFYYVISYGYLFHL